MLEGFCFAVFSVSRQRDTQGNNKNNEGKQREKTEMEKCSVTT
jgi:hypothetical protein